MDAWQWAAPAYSTMQHSSALTNAACPDAVGNHVDAWQARSFACHLILSSLEFDYVQLAACHAGAQKQKKQEACLLAEVPSLLLPAGLMHLETAGNNQSVCVMHQLVTRLT